jgi:predicted transposase/invertase (TIGR01784 family)
VTGDIIPIQIIDSRELSESENLWLKNLDNELNVERINRITVEIARLGKSARIKAYLDAIVRANPETLEEAIHMSDVTLEQVFERTGLIAKWEARGEVRGKMEGKREVAKNLINIGLSLEQIAQVTGLDIETLTQ